MKKIPTLFQREFENHKIVDIKPIVTEGLEWVLEGKGVATVKYDGACCAIINGEFYKRFDAKKGKKAPDGAIPCCEPDPVTGHHPHWVKVEKNNPADKWFVCALGSIDYLLNIEGTYEAVGPHFQGNPYGLPRDTLFKHGDHVIEVPRSFEGIKQFLTDTNIEGIVFWLDGEPRCKIKRTDFGLPWNNKN